MASWYQTGPKAADTSKWDTATLLRDLPQLAQAYGDQLTPAALAQLEADKAVGAGYGQLGLDLYRDYGTQFGEIGRSEASKDTLAAGQTELDLAHGSGSKLADLAMQLQRKEDAPYYDTRELVGKGLAEWFAGQDPNKLSGSERAEMEKTATRSIGYNPSTANAVANATHTGEALANKQSRFAQNVTNISSALPTLKSGLDVTKVATSRESKPNTGMQYFQGTPTTSGQWAVNPLSQYTSGVQSASQAFANRQKSGMDQVGSTIGTVASIAGAFCWVARAAYGEHDKRWIDFANWLSIDAPEWLHNMYVSSGEQFAEWVKVHSTVQRFLRFFMNKVI